MRKMKKAVLLVLLAVMVISPVFAVAGTMFTYDIQTCLQNILQKMQDAEHYASTYKKWAEDLAQYKRQIEQMERYYEELKGVSESIKDANFLQVWNGTKQMLRTASNLIGTSNQVVDKTEKKLNNSRVVLMNVENKLDEMTFKEDEYSIAIDELTKNYYIEVQTHLLNLSAKRSAYKSGNSTLKRNWDTNVRKAIQYEQEKMKIYNLAIKQSVEPLISQEEETIKEMRADLMEIKNAKRDIEASILELANAHSVLDEKLHEEDLPQEAETEIFYELNSLRDQIEILQGQATTFDELIKRYESKDSDCSILLHEASLSSLVSRRAWYQDFIDSCERLITNYNALIQESV